MCDAGEAGNIQKGRPTTERKQYIGTLENGIYSYFLLWHLIGF